MQTEWELPQTSCDYFELNDKSCQTPPVSPKNTLMLYFRQILIMLVSLYTVQVVLEILVAEDYGIYNFTKKVYGVK
ncbi:hypothetical protein AGMMS50268_12740 [Spirochaetia bacterium]|nr:hypothetical protein AGMMS50268_12740 [Spirochaetia bacterium]